LWRRIRSQLPVDGTTDNYHDLTAHSHANTDAATGANAKPYPNADSNPNAEPDSNGKSGVLG